MGQIEVLYDLGEPYVRLEDYRAVQARADALAAEVARLSAENAALRAQLDAGEEWRPVTENPAKEGEYIVAGEYPGEDVFTTACTWYGNEWLNRHTELPVHFTVLLWRPLPAPPQE